MKQAPQQREISKRFLPSKTSGDGYMGNDQRSVDQIITDDAATLERLGITRESLADALESAYLKVRNSMVGEIEIRPGLIAQYHEARGKIPSPFPREGSFEKGDVVLSGKDGEQITVTRLAIHLIRNHGFFQGQGAPFRIEPEKAARMLGLIK